MAEDNLLYLLSTSKAGPPEKADLHIDVDLLKQQRDWLFKQPQSDEVEGLTLLLEALIDLHEGYLH